MLDIYLTNLGKYNESELVGKWLELPCEQEEINNALKEIGIDGICYEEYFITDVETDIPTLHDNIGEYTNINELNYLAECIDDMDAYLLDTYEHVVEYINDHEGSLSIQDYINFTYEDNLDSFMFMSNVENEEDLGRYLVDELGYLSIPEELEYYFDYESYGSDYNKNGLGGFVDGGYMERTSDSMTEYYGGLSDLPEYESSQNKNTSMKM